MKKKKYNSLIIAVAALVVVGGAYLGLSKYNDYKEKQAAAEEEADSIYINQMETIQKVSIKNSYGEYGFSHNGEKWVYDGDSAFPLDQSLITSIASQGISLTALTVYEEIDELSAYGLDAAGTEVTFTDAAGKAVTISFGNEVNSNYYCKENVTDQVYTIDANLYTELQKDLFDFVLLDTFAYQTGDVQGYTITINGNEYYFEKETTVATTSSDAASEETETTEEEVTTWYVTVNGVRSEVTDTNAVDALDSAITGMSFTECVEYNCDEQTKESYGITTPTCELTVHYLDSESNEATCTVVIGNEAEEAYYGMLAESSQINLISNLTVSNILDAVQTISNE